MNDALYVAATGMQLQQMNVETIANNLANVNTPGFKKGRISFQDLVYRSLNQLSPAEDAQNLARGSGVGLLSLSKLFTTGEINKTGNPLDLAIRGDGFFEVELSDGTTAFTRGGSLIVNKDGLLATADGMPIKPNLHFGTDVKEVVIGADGRVSVRSGSDTNATEIGRIELVNFADMSGLQPIGAGMYRTSERSGDPIYGKPGDDNVGTIAQGHLEASNVKMVDEMVNLMVAQRAYEMNIKVIQAADEMVAMSNNLRR